MIHDINKVFKLFCCIVEHYYTYLNTFTGFARRYHEFLKAKNFRELEVKISIINQFKNENKV